MSSVLFGVLAFPIVLWWIWKSFESVERYYALLVHVCTPPWGFDHS